MRQGTVVLGAPHSPTGRVLAALIGVAAVALAFVLFAAAVLTAVGIAVASLVRLWWIRRRPDTAPEMLSVEYTVQAGEPMRAAEALPPGRPHS